MYCIQINLDSVLTVMTYVGKNGRPTRNADEVMTFKTKKAAEAYAEKNLTEDYKIIPFRELDPLA
jgi:hypothetical protein